MERSDHDQRLTDEEYDTIPSGNRWPGNRLSYLDMRRLTYVSNKVKRPINQIIKEAVSTYTMTMIAELENEATNDRGQRED